MGVVPVRKSLPLAVGGAVHEGLAVLLKCAQGIPLDELSWELAEMKAVDAALADFAQAAGKLDAGASGIREQNADASVARRAEAVDYQAWLYEEQAALVEALVRAYARRRLRPLLEQFEVLEVEREGEWKLGDLERYPYSRGRLDSDETEKYGELWFMSRPDALLLERSSRELYLQSYKTAAGWEVRKERDAQRDAQGLSEGVEVEKRLGEWWDYLQKYVEAAKERLPGYTDNPLNMDQDFVIDEIVTPQVLSPGASMEMREVLRIPRAMVRFLMGCPAPPRIMGIRYEYMLKGDRDGGERNADRFIEEKFGAPLYTQRSHLVRAYRDESRGISGASANDAAWCWSWGFLKSDYSGEQSKLNYRHWKSAPVWEHMTVKEWIDKLDASAPMQVESDIIDIGTNAPAMRDVGYVGPAQAIGLTTRHPLDAVFPAPMTVYRNDDELRDWMEQTEAQEREIAERVAEVHAAQDEGERRSLLNRYFPQSRRACEYPTTCAFVPLCWGGDDIRRDPEASGKYEARRPNHPQEVEAAKHDR